MAGYARSVVMWGLVALVTHTGLRAQRMPFRQYGSADGLTNLSVTSLVQDRSGFLWVGTDNGLFRYEGDRFRKFARQEGLPSSEVSDLTESPDGTLWVATQGGIARLAHGRFEALDIGEHSNTGAIAFDRIGRMYVKGVSGILRGDPDGHGSYRFHTVVQGPVRGLQTSGESVWFIKDGDLWQLVDDRMVRAGSPFGLPSDRWSAVIEDSLGNLWVRSPTHLYELRQGHGSFEDRSEGIPDAPETDLHADRHGRVYVTGDHGAVILDGARRQYLDYRHGLPMDSVGTVLLGADESLWIGTSGGGLLRRLGRGQWISWTTEDGLTSGTVWSIHRDRVGRVWVGSSLGVNLIDSSGTVVRSWTARNGLSGHRVTAFAEGPSGDMYVTTNPLGLSHFNSKGALLETYGGASGLTGNYLHALAFDRRGFLWVGGDAGCFRSTKPIGQGGRPFFEHVELPADRANVRSLLVDTGDTVWMATSNGLYRYIDGRIRRFVQADGLRQDDLEMVVEGQGAIWVVYRDSLGISRLQFHGDRLEVTHYTSFGQLSALVYSTAFDSGGRLWVGTDNGVAVFADGHWRHYGREDGLVSDDTDSRAILAGRAGEVWIGTSSGLSRFAPLPYALPNTPPVVAFSGIVAGGRECDPASQPALAFARRSVQLRFTALAYSDETRVKFRYRLLGYDESWTETNERSVQLAGLPPGHFVVELAAAGPDGIWSSIPARFAFSIRPPWWLSWWFLAICLVLLAIVVRAILHLRMRAYDARQMELERQIAERTAELRESHRQLEEYAYCDVLTSLPNRRMFADVLHMLLMQAQRSGNSFAMLLADLNHFKQVNDTYGHDAGDAVLRETAVRLRISTRQADSVSRLGGDEFAILLTTVSDLASIEAVCQRIVAAFDSPIEFNGTNLRVTCSVGVALCPQDGDTADLLYKAADQALYQAKRTQKHFCFRSDIEEFEPAVSDDLPIS